MATVTPEGPGPLLPPIGDVAALVRTREEWHTLAEHVVAPARYRVEGRIGLRATPGGFGTPVFGDGGQVRVAGTDLVVIHGERTTTVPITTVAEAAAAVGIEPGAPTEVYTPATPLDPDAPLVLDRASTTILAAWFALSADVLERLRADAGPADRPSLVQLWPEHFDLAVELGDETHGARGTFGASPGDDQHPEPYLYVTHGADVPDDPYWNDTAFAGASLGYAALRRSDDPCDAAFAFFGRGRESLAARR